MTAPVDLDSSVSSSTLPPLSNDASNAPLDSISGAHDLSTPSATSTRCARQETSQSQALLSLPEGSDHSGKSNRSFLHSVLSRVTEAIKEHDRRKVPQLALDTTESLLLAESINLLPASESLSSAQPVCEPEQISFSEPAPESGFVSELTSVAVAKEPETTSTRELENKIGIQENLILTGNEDIEEEGSYQRRRKRKLRKLLGDPILGEPEPPQIRDHCNGARKLFHLDIVSPVMQTSKNQGKSADQSLLHSIPRPITDTNCHSTISVETNSLNHPIASLPTGSPSMYKRSAYGAPDNLSSDTEAADDNAITAQRPALTTVSKLSANLTSRNDTEDSNGRNVSAAEVSSNQNCMSESDLNKALSLPKPTDNKKDWVNISHRPLFNEKMKRANRPDSKSLSDDIQFERPGRMKKAGIVDGDLMVSSAIFSSSHISDQNKEFVGQMTAILDPTAAVSNEIEVRISEEELRDNVENRIVGKSLDRTTSRDKLVFPPQMNNDRSDIEEKRRRLDQRSFSITSKNDDLSTQFADKTVPPTSVESGETNLARGSNHRHSFSSKEAVSTRILPRRPLRPLPNNVLAWIVSTCPEPADEQQRLIKLLACSQSLSSTKTANSALESSNALNCSSNDLVRSPNDFLATLRSELASFARPKRRDRNFRPRSLTGILLAPPSPQVSSELPQEFSSTPDSSVSKEVVSHNSSHSTSHSTSSTLEKVTTNAVSPYKPPPMARHSDAMVLTSPVLVLPPSSSEVPLERNLRAINDKVAKSDQAVQTPSSPKKHIVSSFTSPMPQHMTLSSMLSKSTSPLITLTSAIGVGTSPSLLPPSPPSSLANSTSSATVQTSPSSIIHKNLPSIAMSLTQASQMSSSMASFATSADAFGSVDAASMFSGLRAVYRQMNIIADREEAL
ncbi:unnamed protein product [Protopolystoma xenopodis]|uniref:Uncharacterized protein n=1 Tax=Protopolystoma xenopodis TaxID=117903 RepID=A0A3S5CHG9_9PLAT|nr:unnamed protein product [Protopolystoma xenopodis]